MFEREIQCMKTEFFDNVHYISKADILNLKLRSVYYPTRNIYTYNWGAFHDDQPKEAIVINTHLNGKIMMLNLFDGNKLC